jgi:hypothetical protein
MSFKNADYIRNLPGDLGPRLYEALADLEARNTTLAQQVNGNPTGEPAAPPNVGGLNVTGRDGSLHVAITDNSPIYRGIQYHLEHADNPHFINPIPISMGTARHVTIPIGNQTRYVRVASSYSVTAPSQWVYHGGSQPIGVNGGGMGPGPQFLPSQGSGTGAPGEGLQGSGTKAFRSVNGAPPKR